MTAIAKEIKQKILNSVKEEGIAVSKLSQEYGISTVTIYAWIKGEGEQNKGNGVNLGEFTAELNKTKKEPKIRRDWIVNFIKRIKSKYKNINIVLLCKSFEISKSRIYYKRKLQ